MQDSEVNSKNNCRRRGREGTLLWPDSPDSANCLCSLYFGWGKNPPHLPIPWFLSQVWLIGQLDTYLHRNAEAYAAQTPRLIKHTCWNSPDELLTNTLYHCTHHKRALYTSSLPFLQKYISLIVVYPILICILRMSVNSTVWFEMPLAGLSESKSRIPMSARESLTFNLTARIYRFTFWPKLSDHTNECSRWRLEHPRHKGCAELLPPTLSIRTMVSIGSNRCSRDYAHSLDLRYKYKRTRGKENLVCMLLRVAESILSFK